MTIVSVGMYWRPGLPMMAISLTQTNYKGIQTCLVHGQAAYNKTLLIRSSPLLKTTRVAKAPCDQTCTCTFSVKDLNPCNSFLDIHHFNLMRRTLFKATQHELSGIYRESHNDIPFAESIIQAWQGIRKLILNDYIYTHALTQMIFFHFIFIFCLPITFLILFPFWWFSFQAILASKRNYRLDLDTMHLIVCYSNNIQLIFSITILTVCTSIGEKNIFLFHYTWEEKISIYSFF